MSGGGVYIVAGRMGCGKTTFVKALMQSTDCFKAAYALVKCDYDEVTQFKDYEYFLHLMNSKTDSIFVIDEAYTCLPDALQVRTKPLDRMLAEILVNSRKYNNLIFIVFHNLQQMKKWLPAYTNYFVRFNTQDQISYQLARFKSYSGMRYSLVNKPSFEPFIYSADCQVPVQGKHYHLIKMQ